MFNTVILLVLARLIKPSRATLSAIVNLLWVKPAKLMRAKVYIMRAQHLDSRPREHDSRNMQSDACVLHEDNQKILEIVNDKIFDKFHSYICTLAARRE